VRSADSSSPTPSPRSINAPVAPTGAALLADYEMNVNLKLVNSIMSEHGFCGLPRPGLAHPQLDPGGHP